MKNILFMLYGALVCCSFSAATVISVSQRTFLSSTKYAHARLLFNGDVTANEALSH